MGGVSGATSSFTRSADPVRDGRSGGFGSGRSPGLVRGAAAGLSVPKDRLHPRDEVRGRGLPSIQPDVLRR